MKYCDKTVKNVSSQIAYWFSFRLKTDLEFSERFYYYKMQIEWLKVIFRIASKHKNTYTYKNEY